uniref:bifunctional metallophosphatase/5'-nucleotidase n=1 Tax=Blautia stercoris TaxID=871664 RepID=UPI004025FF0D
MTKIWKKLVVIWLIAVIVLPLMTGMQVWAKTEPKQLDILFTHDTHSHLNSFTTIVNGEKKEVGGFAKLKTLINEHKKVNPDTLVLDGGDFSMGTLIQTVYDTEAAELRMLGQIGCDVTTLGNHEFDYQSKGLADMLNAAKNSGDTVPSLVLCNVDWDAMEEAGLSEGQKQIQSAFEKYQVRDYVVVQKGNIKIAVLGVFGKDALVCAPTCELVWKDPVKAAKQTVEKIKKKEKVDMIACVSHSGTWDDADKSEDEILAKEVPDIDLIISGHTHSQLDKPIQHGNTYIVSCGEYGKNLGTISMTQKDDGRWKATSYELIPVSDEVNPDETTQAKIDALMDTVDINYLAKFGYTRKEVLAENDIEFNSLDEMGTKHEELNLGDIISDAYVYAVENSDNYDGDPVDVAVVPSGTVRDTYAKGEITVESVYNSFSLGIGKDGLAGYPLISAYLTGKELKLVAEIDASISDFMTIARLYCSGLNFNFNPHRMILNKVTDCYLTGQDGKREEIQDDKLYHVVTDLYTGQMLGSVMDISYGLLSIIPKDKEGNPIEDLEEYAIMEENQELKAWVAIARYMQSFDDTDGDGIANVSEYYATTHGRKVVENSRNLVQLLKNPNKFFMLMIGIITVAVLIVLLLIFFIRKVLRKRR